MNKMLIFILLSLVFSQAALGHGGRTDSKGGHNCSAKSKQKGLCTRYHYHNGKRYANATHHHDEEVGHDDLKKTKRQG